MPIYVFFVYVAVLLVYAFKKTPPHPVLQWVVVLVGFSIALWIFSVYGFA